MQLKNLALHGSLKKSTLTERDSEDKDVIVEPASKITTFTKASNEFGGDMIKFLTKYGKENYLRVHIYVTVLS